MDEINFSEAAIVANISNDVFVQTTKSGKILFFNNKAACVFGRIKKGGYLSDILTEEKFFLLKKNIETAFYNQYPHHFYWDLKNRFYLVYVYPQTSSVWLCFNDISEKRQLSHLLHVNNQRIEFSEKIAKSGYWELDIKNKKFYWSDEVYNIFGIRGDKYDFQKNLIRELVYPEDLIVYKQKLKELLLKKNNVEGKIRIMTPKDGIKHCRFMSGIVYEDGEAKIAGVFQDITELEEARQSLEAAKKEAEDANKEKSYFLASASHDIRQPLHAIELFAEGLLSAPKKQYPEIAEKILKLSRNLKSMLNNLLEVSKIDAGGFEFRAEEFDLAELLKRICDEYAPLAQEKGLKLQCNLRKFVIKQDIFSVERIVRNLLDNSLKYSKTKIILGNLKNCFWVIDDGDGVSKVEQKHIFKAFYQSNALSRDGGGSVGLGLSVVEKILKIIGGDIKVKSRPKYYAAFRVCLHLN